MENRTNLMKALGDKLYEKRKAAALEIEVIVKNVVKENNDREALEILKSLSETYHSSSSLNLKKGILLALAAAAIGFGRAAKKFLTDLLEPILHASVENDSRVRYFACESLYNVTKVVRTQLFPDHFEPIFTAISMLTSDVDPNVRSGAELLDRLLKDVVSESEIAPNIGQLIRSRIYCSEGSARIFIAGWICLLSGNPAAGFADVLPGIIDGLFQFLDDPAPNVQKQISNALQATLQETARSDISQLLPIVSENLNRSGSQHSWQLRYNTLLWLRHLLPINNEISVKHAAVCIRAIFSMAEVPATDMKESQQNSEIQELRSDVEVLLKEAILEKAKAEDMETILKVLLSILTINRTERLNCFYWLDTVLEKQIDEEIIITHLSSILISTAKTVNIAERDVGIKIVTKISNLSPRCFDHFIHSLTDLIENETEFEGRNRIAFIIRVICQTVKGEEIYSSIAQLIKEKKSVSTVRLMNILLSTSSHLHHVRIKLMLDDGNDEPAVADCTDGVEVFRDHTNHFFENLWDAWIHCPVSSICLALISRRYNLAFQTLEFISKKNMNEEILVEFDRLVQLIESPGFTFLRFELLRRPPVLIATLYGILMLLPQSKAFDILWKRLSVIPVLPVDSIELSKEETYLFSKLKSHCTLN